jgi:hypothetical protein
MFQHLFALPLADSTDSWLRSLVDVSPNDRFSLLIVAIIFGTALTIVLTLTIGLLLRSVRLRTQELEFKRDLLDRGLSPEEVARVVEASPGRTAKAIRQFN